MQDCERRPFSASGSLREPLGAKMSIKKADGSAFGLAAREPRSLRSRGCW